MKFTKSNYFLSSEEHYNIRESRINTNIITSVKYKKKTILFKNKHFYTHSRLAFSFSKFNPHFH